MFERFKKPKSKTGKIINVPTSWSEISLETMDKIAEQVGSSYYILPSSIHETLVVPFSDGMNVEDLKNMVHEVNSTQLSADEILSDSVYIYDYDKHRIVAAA